MSLTLASTAFLEGYRLALRGDVADAPDQLTQAIRGLGPLRAPFATEGAAMAWTLRGARESAPPQLDSLVRVMDACWHPFLRLGVGCALAKLSHPVPDAPDVQDGYGFQHGLTAIAWPPPAGPTPERLDRGWGRGIWFRTGGDADACARLIGDGPASEERWRGIATACAFAGDPEGHAARLRSLSGGRGDPLRSGARDALRTWRSLGTPPARVHAVVDVLEGP